MKITPEATGAIESVVREGLRKISEDPSWPLPHIATTVEVDVDSYQAICSRFESAWTPPPAGEGVRISRQQLTVVPSALEAVRHERNLTRGEVVTFLDSSPPGAQLHGPATDLRNLAATARKTQLDDVLRACASGGRVEGDPFASLDARTLRAGLGRVRPRPKRTLVTFGAPSSELAAAIKEERRLAHVSWPSDSFSVPHGAAEVELLGILFAGRDQFVVRYLAYDITVAVRPGDDAVHVRLEERRGLHVPADSKVVLYRTTDEVADGDQDEVADGDQDDAD